jgi:hypothetical protein
LKTNLMNTNPSRIVMGMRRVTNMGMKPRLDTPNKRLVPNVCTAPNTHPGEENYEHLTPVVVSCKRTEESKKLDPNLVSGPKQHGE